MDRAQQQEQFSQAYVRAVASVAGFCVYRPEVDDDSVDFGIAARGGAGTYRSPRLEAQLKCTFSQLLGPEDVRFPLKLKNYDDLRGQVFVPRILVVVLVPENVTEWLRQTEDEMVLKRCGYWVSLFGRPEVPNTTSVTVELPRENVFTPSALGTIMGKVSRGLPL